jgi:phage shock protein A
MSLTKRMSAIFKAKASKILDRAEDPRETLDYSYERMLEQLTKVRRGVADVATSRKRIELQAAKLQESGTKLEGQARQAIGAGREDLAREALSRRAAIVTQLEDLKTQHATLDQQEAQLTMGAQRLQAKVDSFRVRKETIKATYTAAEAQTKIGEAVAGISEEMGDVGLAVQRAEDKTAQLQARAGALDELMASGALEDVSQPSDHIQAELDRMTLGSGVEAELAAMKAELGTGQKSLEAHPAEPATLVEKEKKA